VLRDGIVQGIEQAAKDLAPAKVGWTVADAREHTNCRRWVLRPDRIGTDPFGQRNIRAMMHPGHQSPNHVGPAGPIDPDLTLLAVQSSDGRPIAVLANFSQHYFGAGAVSSDYFGIFCAKLAAMLGADVARDSVAESAAERRATPPFVAMMSQGTSGDLHWMDYSLPKKNINIQQYAEALAKIAQDALKKIEYRDWAPIAACEKKLTLGRRTPDEKRLAWAKEIIAQMKGPVPKSQREVYAKEAVYLHEEPTRELKLQAIRVGELGITAIPCEVFGITGLKLKAQSPMAPTMNIELANGAEGYIPPPEQHALGGYTTWPARTAGLEVQAEPKIVEAVLQCLEEAAGKPRRKIAVANGPCAGAILASKPLAYWRMEEINWTPAADAVGNCPATYEDCIALYLEGPQSPAFSGEGRINRCPHFAGGRMKAAAKGLRSAYTVEFWFWNGLPSDAREVTGYVFSRGADGDRDARGDHLGIGGKGGVRVSDAEKGFRPGGADSGDVQGKLIFYNGNVAKELLAGTTDIPLRTWHHVALVRDGKRVTVYLDGKQEIAGEAAATLPDGTETVFLGGRCDNIANFAGKLDEAALFPRALSADEVARHHATAGVPR